MESAPPIVRIVVLSSDEGNAAGDTRGRSEAAGLESGDVSSLDDGTWGSRTETLAALRRIGAELELDCVPDVAACLEAVEGGDVDLVVVDRCPPATCSELLDRISADSLPVLVVIGRDSGEDAALEAFRRGASDCVRVADDYVEILPVVALEQIRRWRQHRERRASEIRIEWLERLQEAIISEIPVGLAVVDGEGRVLDVNPEFARAFEVSAKQAEGARLEDILPWDLLDRGGVEDLLRPGARGGARAPGLARTRDAKGALRAFDVRSQRLDDEGRMLLVLSDVSETDLLTKRVGDLERYNENIIQNINSALLVVDPEGVIGFANPTAGKILGQESEVLLGRSIWDWLGGPAARDGSVLGRTLREGVRFRGAETMISLDDGSVLPIGVSCTPLADEAGETTGAVAIFQDLSEIKQLERQVLQQEKMASIGQLAAGVAHEINNPMGFIHANLHQLSEYLGDLDGYLGAVAKLQNAVDSGDPGAARQASDQLAEVADRIDLGFVREDIGKAVRESQEGSERIRHIVRDLREFSHQGTAERTLADINQCVDSTASIVWTMMKDAVILEKDYAELPQVSGYPMQLKQVFMNLLVNAYQAITERIGESGDVGVIRIVTAIRGDGVAITIRDSGVGIPAAHLERIFDPFFTTKEVGAGTGLGLSTSYGIIERHGGRMTVNSRVGEGSTFEIWLPVRPPDAVPEPPA